MKPCRTKVTFPAACLLCLAIAHLAQAAGAGKVNMMQTPSGTRFGVLGTKGSAPAPTLFVFATQIEPTLTSAYNKVGTIVGRHGYLCVSLDLPCHPGGGLPGWAATVRSGNPLVSEFVSEVSQVLDYLIREGYTDPKRVAVAGTSRGGFMAMHIAAAEPRIKCAIGFVPVTDLTDLTEFAGLEDNKFAKSLALANVADKLAGRPLWVAIGNNDGRVNTDRAIEFTRTVVAASVAKEKRTPTDIIDVELHVMPWSGHGGNQRWSGDGGDLNAHDAAAAWLLARMGEGAAK